MAIYLITGGAGFIGSHLSERLLTEGNTVYSLDNLSTGNYSNIQHLTSNPNFHFARADVNDKIVMDRLASKTNVIIHLAAAVGVKLIVDKPVHTLETNVNGTESVLQSALRYNNKVVITSTSEVYGKGYKIPFSEDDDVLLGPTRKNRWAYAASKMLDEFLAFAYHKEFKLKVVIARLFNTVGPKQSGQYGMVIPRFINQAINNEPITIYDTGEQKRCFCHVKDVVRALIALSLNEKADGEVFNIGSEEEVSIKELALLIKDIIKSESVLKNISFEEAYNSDFEDMERRIPDLLKIKKLFDWKPTYSLQEIIKDAYNYEKSKIVT